jgi:hypothetical protein
MRFRRADWRERGIVHEETNTIVGYVKLSPAEGARPHVIEDDDFEVVAISISSRTRSPPSLRTRHRGHVRGHQFTARHSLNTKSQRRITNSYQSGKPKMADGRFSRRVSVG